MAGLVLHYLADWSPLLTEIVRVLAPRGGLVTSVHHPMSDQRVPTMDPSGHGAYLDSYQIIDRWEFDGAAVDVTSGTTRSAA